ncbi:uncharacterized protein [Antedon mediterranea]|uniref:uncharacterized protein n=1 Tax=Antedon mediterranea TaxID=105859 RepID=UPI003AF65E54
MGCGSSAATDSTTDINTNSNLNLKKKANTTETTSSCIITSNNNKEEDSNSSLNGDDNEGSRITCRDSGIDSAKSKTNERRRMHNDNTSRHQPQSANLIPNSKGVAFDVVLDNEEKQDSIIKRHPPKRLLQKLEQTPPKVTAELLAERQQVTEERRRKVIEGRAKSAKRTSRFRKDILAAKEFNEKEMVEESKNKISEKMSSADNKRAHAQEEIKMKQRQRETKAKQVRERAKQFNQIGADELSYDIEKDETYNNDDDDSWLDDSNNRTVSKESTSSERIYDGRSSPAKKFHPITSAERRKKQQSLNTDSDVDDDEGWANMSNGHQQNDDFFDT